MGNGTRRDGPATAGTTNLCAEPYSAPSSEIRPPGTRAQRFALTSVGSIFLSANKPTCGADYGWTSVLVLAGGGDS